MNSNNYGYYIDDFQKYSPLDSYYEVEVTESVSSWSKFAKQHGISYRMLKVYNPWLRDTKLTVIKNSYKIKVPRK